MGNGLGRAAPLAPGQHVFFGYGSDAEQTHVLVDFVREGLERGERVLYFADRVLPSDIELRLSRRGINTEAAIRDGRLTLLSASSAYLAPGRFDADAVKAQWFDAIRDTIAKGYSTMRVAADMGWAARGFPGANDLLKYESSVEDVFATGRVIAMCEFDERIFKRDALHELESLHDLSAQVPPICCSPEMEMHFIADSDGVAIGGEVDVYNHADFEEALQTVLATIEGDVHLDVSALRFIDIGGLTTIVRATRALTPGATLVLHGMRPYLRRVVHLVGWENTPNLRFEDAPPAVSNG